MVFFEQGWEKFSFGKNVLKRPTLSMLYNSSVGR